MSALKKPIETWFLDENEEEDMHEDHAYLWQHFIKAQTEKDLTNAQVLDYGCNRGGFLRMLFEEKPFRQGFGIDIAEKSLALARKKSDGLPIAFVKPDALDSLIESIDVAYSHEVLYLLADLGMHAKKMAASLKKGGTYYAAIGCHTGNPLWAAWHKLITDTTNIPVFSYSLDDYAKAFWNAGLEVSMRPFQYDGLVKIKQNNAYFPKAADSLEYHTTTKTIIAARKAK